MDQNNQNIVLVNNSRNAKLNSNAVFEFLRQFAIRYIYYFSKKFGQF